MRLSGSRLFVGAAALLAGIVGVNLTMTDAAEAVPEAEFKDLVDQDAKNILLLLKDGKPEKKTADRSIKSSSLMIAAYAQSRISGKNPAEDAKMAALRDAALQVAKTGGKKKYMEAVAPAKTLSVTITAPAKADTAKKDLVKETEIDLEELMYQFKKAAVGGLGIEEEIKANAKKPAANAARAAAIGQRVLIVGDFVDTVHPSTGFSAAKPKADWDRYNKDMKTAATEVIAASKGLAAKDGQKKLQTAFDKLDRSCVECHNKFK